METVVVEVNDLAISIRAPSCEGATNQRSNANSIQTFQSAPPRVRGRQRHHAVLGVVALISIRAPSCEGATTALQGP